MVKVDFGGICYNTLEDIELELLEEVNVEDVKPFSKEDNLRLQRIIHDDEKFHYFKKYKELEDKVIWIRFEVDYDSEITEKYYLMDKEDSPKDEVYLHDDSYSGGNPYFMIVKPFMLEKEFGDIAEFYESEQDRISEIYKDKEGYSYSNSKEFFNTFRCKEFTTTKEVKDMVDEELKKFEESEKQKKEDRDKSAMNDDFKKSEAYHTLKEDYALGNHVKVNIRHYYTLEVEGKVIEHSHSKFYLDLPVHEILPFEFWDSINTSYNGDLDMVENYLLEKRIGYIKHKGEYTNKGYSYSESYKVSFKEGVIKVNGVKIPKNKIIFILKRADKTSDKIKLLKKLNGRAVQLLDMKKMEISHISLNVDVGFDTIDGVVFDMEFMGNKYMVDYKDINPLFFGDNGREIRIRNYVNSKKLISFVTNTLGIDKSDFYAYIKRIKMIQSLGDD